jgi:hypothetical protein
MAMIHLSILIYNKGLVAGIIAGLVVPFLKRMTNGRNGELYC